MGVVVRKYPHNNYYFSLYNYNLLVLALFWQQHPYFFVHFKMVFRSCTGYHHAVVQILVKEMCLAQEHQLSSTNPVLR